MRKNRGRRMCSFECYFLCSLVGFREFELFQNGFHLKHDSPAPSDIAVIDYLTCLPYLVTSLL
jgi:hypothetical protein